MAIGRLTGEGRFSAKDGMLVGWNKSETEAQGETCTGEREREGERGGRERERDSCERDTLCPDIHMNNHALRLACQPRISVGHR